MDIRKTYYTDPTLEAEGVWVELGEGARIRVARAGNPANRRKLSKLLERHRATLRSRNLPDDILERVTIETMAETILLGWDGINEDGKPLPYTPENARRLLTTYRDFRDQVAAIAADMALFKGESEEAASKN